MNSREEVKYDKVFGINNCTSVRNVLKFFEEKGKKVEYVNLKKEKPTWQEMQQIKQIGGFETIDLFNSNGKLFAEIGLKEKLDSLSEEEAFKLLITDALLFKRPLVVDGNYARTGWNKKEYEEKWS
ncbi:ArsC family transcriptional regulator [Francisella endosymbiont of Ornithodoros moubata]|uniref:arsenate reductase family protein n=1 Tax=Francisella-like endosymbiont TaxID=512373 RepID=UPI000A24DDE5|nr:ArsC family transcriptional regulator [Francisella endosymbiont of Ornithodoros moubata]